MARWIPLFENGAPNMEEAMCLTGEYGISLFPSDDATPPVPANPQTKVIRSGQQPKLSVLDTRVTVPLDAADTERRYGLVRIDRPRDAGPPVHIHENEDEMFIVEEGRVEFTLGEDIVVGGKGDMVWPPRGYAHTFRLLTDDARLTVFMTPGGVEQFFVECDRLELAGGADPAAIVDLCAQLGMSFPAR